MTDKNEIVIEGAAGNLDDSAAAGERLPDSPEAGEVHSQGVEEMESDVRAEDGMEVQRGRVFIPRPPEPADPVRKEAVVEGEKPPLRWYVVHTYSGFEMKAKKALEERVVSLGKKDYFGEVLVPSENVITMVAGKKRTSNRKFFPGYILVQMSFTDDTWHVVKNTPKVTGFVGGAKRPPAIPEEDVRRVTQQIHDGAAEPKLKTIFEKGESVRVIDGPFLNFNGVVDDVKPEKGKLRVLVSIFGRATSVELDFVQVEKN